MNDMRAVIVPKTDQLNADSLLAGPITITISSVDIRPGTEQPVSIFYDGDNGKPYKPCKSMARVMVHCWGPDANQYVGRSMTLYCDPKVQWGGMAVGGIRISHMTDIDSAHTMALTATKGNKKPFTVKPLEAQAAARTAPDAPKRMTIAAWLDATEGRLRAAETAADVDAIKAEPDTVKALAGLKNGALTRLQAMLDEAHGRHAQDGNGSQDGEDDGTLDGNANDAPARSDETAHWVQGICARLESATTLRGMFEIVDEARKRRDVLKQDAPELDARIDAAVKAANARLSPPTGGDAAGDRAAA